MIMIIVLYIFVYCILFCFVYCFILNKILKYNYGEKLLKVPAIIYADVECLLEKMHSWQNNPEKPYTEKKTKHTPSGYSLFTNCSFDDGKKVWKGFVKT